MSPAQQLRALERVAALVNKLPHDRPSIMLDIAIHGEKSAAFEMLAAMEGAKRTANPQADGYTIEHVEIVVGGVRFEAQRDVLHDKEPDR